MLGGVTHTSSLEAEALAMLDLSLKTCLRLVVMQEPQKNSLGMMRTEMGIQCLAWSFLVNHWNKPGLLLLLLLLHLPPAEATYLFPSLVKCVYLFLGQSVLCIAYTVEVLQEVSVSPCEQTTLTSGNEKVHHSGFIMKGRSKSSLRLIWRSGAIRDRATPLTFFCSLRTC